MIAMQYRIALPADYDMAIIRQRIAERGHLTDNLEGLAFKAYLHGRVDASRTGSQNVYAPFYVWRESRGLSEFLSGPGFAAVAASFGRPVVRTWAVWDAEFSTDLSAATYATHDTAAISPQTSMDETRRREQKLVRAALDQGAEAAVSAFDPTTWTLMRFALWRDASAAHDTPRADAYTVGHMSQPKLS
jgi:hypothetical protein